MSFQEKNSKQKLDSDKPYDVMHGLNIEFRGLLTLEITSNHENSRQSINDYLSKATNNIRCQKADHVGASYEVLCINNNKQDAIDSIKDFLSIILKQEKIKHINIGISISLSFMNHKSSDRPMIDPIDYSLLEGSQSKVLNIFPKLIEPVEPQFATWNGEKWSVRLY